MKHDQATADKARALRATGMTARAIGAQLGVLQPTVEGWFRGRNSTPRAPRFNTDAPNWVHSDETVAEARALRKAGMAVPAISKQLGVPICTIESWIYARRRPSQPCS